MDSPTSGISLSTSSEELELECSSEVSSEPCSPGYMDIQSPESEMDSELDTCDTTDSDHVFKLTSDSDGVEELDIGEVVSAEDNLSLALTEDGPLYPGSSVTILQAVVMFLYFILR